MRRKSSLILLGALLVMVAVTPRPEPTQAAEGDPGDYCSHSPETPLGWQFSEACRAHDECIDILGTDLDVPGRLDCDKVFLADLLAAPHATAATACGENLACRFLARVYFVIVRFVTEQITRNSALLGGGS